MNSTDLVRSITKTKFVKILVAVDTWHLYMHLMILMCMCYIIHIEISIIICELAMVIGWWTMVDDEYIFFFRCMQCTASFSSPPLRGIDTCSNRPNWTVQILMETLSVKWHRFASIGNIVYSEKWKNIYKSCIFEWTYEEEDRWR